MRMQKSRANLHRRRNGGGFSVVELIITATIVTIVTAFGLMGITRAKASIRLAGSTREYASYVEKARVFSIRSHADDAAERASIAINENRTSYDITMDLDGDGDLDTRTIPLPDGIEFVRIETVAFDWRGRTYNTVDGTIFPNAQVSIRLKNSYETASVDITGSGDVTINSAVFDDEVPNVTLNVGDLAAGATPVPTPDTTGTPNSNPGDTTGDPDPVDSTDPGDVTTPPDSNPSGTATPTPSPTPSPSPAATASPRPTAEQTPDVCTITADPASLSLDQDGTATIKVSHNASVSLSITASSSKSSGLQVTPGGAQPVAVGGSATFTVKSKKSAGDYSVTFKASCGQKEVTVTVLETSQK